LLGNKDVKKKDLTERICTRGLAAITAIVARRGNARARIERDITATVPKVTAVCVSVGHFISQEKISLLLGRSQKSSFVRETVVKVKPGLGCMGWVVGLAPTCEWVLVRVNEALGAARDISPL
jgi:hypothetical protein